MTKINSLVFDKVMEWVEFLSAAEVDRISNFAVERGLGELDFYEWVYIDAKLSYNHAAESTSMGYNVVQQLKEARDELELTHSYARFERILNFTNWLWESGEDADLDAVN